MIWAGLAAAALGLKWGVAPPAGDALPAAWQYVNVMLLLAIGVVWPAIAMRGAAITHKQVAWQGAAIFTGAVPALVVAAFVAGAGTQAICAALALQVGMALLLMGVIRARLGVVATLIAGWLLGAPVAAFIWRDLFPGRWDGWAAAVPTLVLGGAESSPAGCWVLAGISAAAGLALLFMPAEPRAAAAIT